MIEDWYQRVQRSGLLDALAPYTPVVVGAYPLGIAAEGVPLEIVCRAVDLPAFARVLERAYGERDGFALHGGQLDGEEAVFGEFTLDGIPVEVAAQPEHVHRRLGAATLGIDRVLGESGEGARMRLAAAVGRGDDWLEAALSQFGLTRAAVESLATANPTLVRRVMGVRQPPTPARAYVWPVAIGLCAYALIVAAGSARGSQEYTGIMFLVEAVVLGLMFGTRVGMAAALVPLAPVGIWLIGPILVGSTSCGADCGQTIAGYVFVPVLVASGSGVAGALRDRYFPRTPAADVARSR